MSLFKNHFLALSFLSILFLSACNLPDTQKRDDSGESQASFFAEETTGSFLNETFQENISLPKQRSYLMKVCLRDIKHSKAILNHPFIIEELKQDVKTDSNGCLNWNENINFEYLADPVFIQYDRHIKSTGIHTGTFKVSFAINPWDTDNYHNAIDLSKNKVEPLVAADSASEKLSGKSQKQAFDLWLEDGRMFVNDERMGDSNNDNTNYQLKYEFNLNPYIKTKKTSGEVSQYNLKYGQFNARIEIIQRYFVGGDSEKNAYDILSSENIKDAKMEKSILTFSRIFKFKGGPPAKGSLFVRIYLQPSKNVANLKPFVGIFPIGDFRSFRANAFLKILPSPDFIKELEAQLPMSKDFSAQATVGQASTSPAEKSSDSVQSATAKAGSTISWTNIEFDSPVRGLQLLSHKRKISYPAHICFTNNLIAMPLAFQKFRVHGFSQDENKPGEVKTDLKSINTGCLYWTDTIEFDIYECRHYKRGYVIIENPDYNLKIKKYYYINPWDDYFGGKDEQAIDNQEVMKTSCDTTNPKRSEIVLEDVTINTRAMPYENNITSLLEFNATKILTVTLHPKVKIPSDVKKDYDHPLETLVDGAYMLRLMIVRNLLLSDKSDKIDVIYQKDIPVVNSRSGTISAEFPFSTKDHRLFLTRNTLFLQLLPIKHEKVQVDPDEVILKLKDANEKIEDLINKETSLLTPVFTQEIVMDGESHKPLRTFSGSEYLKHLQIEFTKQNGNFDFAKIVAEFKAKSQKATADSTGQRIKPDVYAQTQNLEYLDDTTSGKLAFANWIKNAINTHDTKMDRKTAEQLCSYWFQTYWNGKLSLGEMLLRRACSSAAAADIKYFFDFDRVYFINNVAESRYAGPGTETGINLGSSFSVSTSYSESFSNGIGVGVKAGVGGPLLGKFSSVGGELYSTFDYSRSSSSTDSNSMALGESSNLSVTESRFKIVSNNYTDCITIKPSAKLFQPSSKVWYLKLWDGDIDYSQFFKDTLKDDEKLALTQKGLMVCNATPSTKPFTFYEQYFWVTQPQSHNEIQDSHDERNKKFTIMIRGKQDYSRFRFFLTQKWQKPENANASFQAINLFNNMIQMQSWKTSPAGVHVYREQ